MKGADEEGVGALIYIRVRYKPGYESKIGIATLLRDFVLLQMLKELHMNWSSEWLLQENPQLSNHSRLPFLLKLMLLRLIL